MRKLAGYLKEYRKESVLGPLFKLIEASLELLVPLVIADLIDRGIGGENRTLIFGLCAALVGLGLVGLACSLTAQFFAAKASVGFVKKLKHALFAHIQGFSYDEIARILEINVGTIKSRISRGREKLRERFLSRTELFDNTDV